MATFVDNRQFNQFSPSHILPPAAACVHRIPPLSDDEDEDEDEKTDLNASYIPPAHALDPEPTTHDPRDEGTADGWIERNPSLIRLTGKHPFNSEPPLTRLMRHGFLTPVSIHYVRNHGAVPRGEWATWTVEICGLVHRPARLTMDDLVRRFPHLEIPVTLVCAGNRRKEQNMVRRTLGFNWGPAAISTSVWRGVRLRDVLRWCGVMERGDGAMNVCFEGAEDLPGGGGSKYGTSLRMEVAMDTQRDIMLAYMQNGELLTPDHGYPLRMIIPGFIGGRMVKWLKRIIVTTKESESYYHYKDNRVLPSHVDAELADAEGWWYKPEYIINELNINSVITTPAHDEVLSVNALTRQRPYLMRGYAYSGGGRKITRVEITLDGGETWRLCAIEHPEKPNKYGKYWCWCFWSVEVEVPSLLRAKGIAVRAWDEALNTQPEKLIWNVMGMMNNCWYGVRVNVSLPDKGEIGIAFEHPTQPGNQPGGWMDRQKQPDSSNGSAPLENTATSQFSMSDVKRHSSRNSAWIVVHGRVYDSTAFLEDHPGGVDSILLNAGTDCTEEFDSVHSDRAKSMLNTYCIGELVTTGHTTDVSMTLSGLTALANPGGKVPVRLIAKTQISRSARLFRLALPSADQALGLPVGKHVFLRARIAGKLCIRAYTPTSPAEAVGYFDLLIRIYFKGEHPGFPDGGLMSQHLESLAIGSELEISGPVGDIEYRGRGNFLVDGKPRFARRVAMVAGGTGITPVYQVIQAVMKDQPEDRTEMHLVYANRSEDDILLREELDGWARDHKERLKAWYVVSQARKREEWRYSVGSVTEGILREHIPVGGGEDTLVLVCGPPAMIEMAVVPNLLKLGYDVSNSCLKF